MREYALGIYEKAMPNTLSLKEKLLAAKEIGYDFLELSIDESNEKLERLNWSKETRNNLIKDMQEVGLNIRSLCLSGQRKFPMGSLNDEIRKKSMEIIEKAIILANDLGIRIIQLAGYDVYYEKSTKETKKLFLENLKKATEIASKYGIILAFETMETEFMDTVKKAKTMVDIIESPFLMIYPDLGNIKNASLIYKNNIIDDIKCGAGKITAAHIKESIPGHYREIPFLTGHVNFKECLETLWSLGVRRFVTELWYTGEKDFKINVKFAHDTFEKMLNEIQGDYNA